MYQGSPILSLWNQITLESLTEKEAASMVKVLPELEQLKLSDIDQNVRKLQRVLFPSTTMGVFSNHNHECTGSFGKHWHSHLQGLFNEGSF